MRVGGSTQGRQQSGWDLFGGNMHVIREAPQIGDLEVADIRGNQYADVGTDGPSARSYTAGNLATGVGLGSMTYDPQIEANRRRLQAQIQSSLDATRNRGSNVINPWMHGIEAQSRGVLGQVANAQFANAEGRGPSLVAMQAQQAGDQGLQQALAARARGMNQAALAGQLAGAAPLAQAGAMRGAEQAQAMQAALGAGTQLRNQGLQELAARMAIERANFANERSLMGQQYGLNAGAADRQAEAIAAEQALAARVAQANVASNLAMRASQVDEANKKNAGVTRFVGEAFEAAGPILLGR